ncbi:Transmembrane GTPase fzo-1 [Trichostrongylus colubriformis]|uniref:Transmembrane GTPase fzo-1 n=1 Tax=Trichostrongylus colubriformis TaxID=6319 RepID=A0AAN8FMX7_TRICO
MGKVLRLTQCYMQKFFRKEWATQHAVSYSPGVDLSPEFDSWIDKHCLDADVFVLVSNAESTLTQAEKSFFYRVAKKLSKPNVFILNNRWDASAGESEHIDDVKQQHMTRFRQFLVNELEVATDRDVKDRIFFVSSREVLDSRLKARGLIKTPYQVDGHQVRAMEFEMFEKQFEHCISRSAIRTKFEAHNRRANEIISRMRANVDVVYSAANHNKEFLEKQLQDSTIVFNNCRTNFAQFERAYREQTERLRAEVHLKVSADFSEEIMRLEAIIDRFNMPFMDTKEGIVEYKRALAEFTDKCVSSDLEARCTGGLMSRIWNLENDMFREFCLFEVIREYVTQILAEPYQHKLEEVWRYRAPDFHEDLEFRFTFGLSAIIRRIIAYRSGQPVTAIQTNLLTPMALKNATRSTEDMHNEAIVKAVEENAMMTQMVLTSASYLANGSIGLLIIGGVVYRAVGWRVIAISAATYGGLYLWERMRWNSHAKEQHLKEQFRAHLAARMQQVGAAHTTHCETQAMREMDQVFDGLRATVAGVHREMKEELDKSKKEIEKVDGTLKSLLTIKKFVSKLMTELINGVNDEGFGEVNSERYFSYDIDIIKEESEYYKCKKGTGDDGNDSGSDSAIHSPRQRSSPPVSETMNNSIRSGTRTYVGRQRAITLKNLHKVELLRYRACVGNNSVLVDRNYRYSDSNPRYLCSEEHLIKIAMPYLSTHVALRELADFVGKLAADRSIPAFWEVFLVFMREFFAEYRYVLSMLRMPKKL